jgi:hypothetical protein
VRIAWDGSGSFIPIVKKDRFRREGVSRPVTGQLPNHLARRKCLSRGGSGSIGSRRAKGCTLRRA